MRRLMWFSIGFGAACAWGAYAANTGWWWILLGALALMGLPLILTRRVRNFRVAAAVLLGCAVGLCWFRGFDALRLTQARKADGQTLTGTVYVTDYSYETTYGCAVDCRIYLENKTYSTRVYLNDAAELTPGDAITGDFLFRVTVAGGEAESTYQQGKGIFLLLYQRSEEVTITQGKPSLGEYPAVMRHGIQEILDSCFSEEIAAFARALLLGDSSGLSYEADTAFKISGIRHIVAVSGLHVSILFSVVSLIARRRRWLTALLGMPVLLLFAAIAGFTPSINRACMMQGLILASLLFDREYDPGTSLSFAALVMLMANPLTITSMSFQLSVGCIAGIFLFSGRIQSWMLSPTCFGECRGSGLRARLCRWMAGSVSVTLGSMVFTTPLSAWYFGTVSLIGIVTNLLTLPVVTFIFYGILLTVLLGAVALPLGSGAGVLVSLLMKYVLGLSKILSKAPLAAVYTESIYVVFWLIFSYVLILTFGIGRKRNPKVLACCVALGLCGTLAASWLEPLISDGRMTVLDVGQGQCILLQSKGKTYLVDCGGDYDESTADLAAETLLAQGISRLDGVILTHYDRDHAGGVPYLLTRISADVLFLPDGADENGVAETILPLADAAVRVSDTMELEVGEMRLTIYPGVLHNSSNDSSLAVLFQTESCVILITGDRSGFGERRLLADYDIPDVDVLVVGHHGSGSSTCEELLNAVTPETAIISVGEDNTFGHPAEDVLERLTEAGCTIYRTDRNGTIIYGR